MLVFNGCTESSLIRRPELIVLVGVVFEGLECSTHSWYSSFFGGDRSKLTHRASLYGLIMSSCNMEEK
jgi:hypothetical protein